MKTKTLLISLLALAGLSLQASEPVDFDKAFAESDKIVQQIKRTSFPGRVYNIVDFGAKPDTPDAPCHEAINQAIMTCNQEGGGTVLVPEGTFYTGPITLKRPEAVFPGGYHPLGGLGLLQCTSVDLCVRGNEYRFDRQGDYRRARLERTLVVHVWRSSIWLERGDAEPEVRKPRTLDGLCRTETPYL